MELITYDTPTTLVLDEDSVPTGAQMEGVAFFDPIRVYMLNQNGDQMDTVRMDTSNVLVTFYIK